MSRKNSEDSSLELLLDTMCNTFGGVMFIAISLAVMITMRGAVEQITEDPAEKIDSMKKELALLQKSMEERKAKSEELALALKNMSKDPRLILVHEIAFLEQKLKEKLVETKLKEQKRLLVQTQMQNMLLQRLKIANALQDSKKKNVLLAAELKKLTEELEKQKKMLEKLAPRNMVFNTLVEKKAVPYFIIVDDGKVWAVGPEITGKDYKPSSMVTLEIRGSRYLCHPVPGKGISIFDNKELSQAFLGFLQNLPSERVPEFVISQKDAASFSLLREKLKQRKIFHGFLLQKTDQEVFGYQFTKSSKGTYEY